MVASLLRKTIFEITYYIMNFLFLFLAKPNLKLPVSKSLSYKPVKAFTLTLMVNSTTERIFRRYLCPMKGEVVAFFVHRNKSDQIPFQ